MRKFAKTLAVAATVTALSLSACGRAEESTESEAAGFGEGTKIGVSLPQKTSENWVLAEGLFNDSLTEAGYEPQVQFANGGASEQQNQISAMITNGVEVLVIGAVDGSQLGTQLQEAKDAGITVIAYDRLLTNTENVDYYAAYDNYTVGTLQGQALLEGMAAQGEGPYNVELFAGSPDDANAPVFFEGAMSVLQPEIDNGNLVVVSGQTEFGNASTQGWKAENAQTRMDALLSANYATAELDGVLSPNDTLARAILTSVESAGKPLPIVTGQDSEVESVKLIMEGKQYSTINKDTRALVARSIDMVKSLGAGEEPETNNNESNNGVKDVPAYLLEPVIVTKENAAESYANDPTLSALVK